MNVISQAERVREAMDAAGAMLSEEQALTCAVLYREWELGRTYEAGEYLRHGYNSVGDPQLYKVNQTHVSQSDWVPSKTTSIYTAIGLNDSGYPVWSQPTGEHDAYNMGDVVDYNGVLYRSVINGNVWRPDTYLDGWEKIVNE